MIIPFASLRVEERKLSSPRCGYMRQVLMLVLVWREINRNKYTCNISFNWSVVKNVLWLLLLSGHLIWQMVGSWWWVGRYDNSRAAVTTYIWGARPEVDANPFTCTVQLHLYISRTTQHKWKMFPPAHVTQWPYSRTCSSQPSFILSCATGVLCWAW